MIYALCIIISLFVGFFIGVQATLRAVEKRAIDYGSEWLLKSVQSFRPNNKE
jgi:hypothetical protein